MNLWDPLQPRLFLILFLLLLGAALVSPTGLSAAQEQIQNPVVPNARLGPFRHGTFPSLQSSGQEWTHMGVDLVASEGSPVFAFGDGMVVAIVTKADPEFYWAGNAVMIEHPVSPRPLHTIYLHLKDSPMKAHGDSTFGGKTQIGIVGKTGAAHGVAHTHFEIRFFKEWISRWGNIYGPGDQRQSAYFKANWDDPEAYFLRFPQGMPVLTAKSQDSPKIPDVRREPQAGLDCERALTVFGKPSLELHTASMGISESFETIYAHCRGVSVEGKSATVLLELLAAIQAVKREKLDPVMAMVVPKGVAIDPFSPSGEFVPPGTKYQLQIRAKYTLYDTGWRVEEFNTESGQRLPGEQTRSAPSAGRETAAATSSESTPDLIRGLEGRWDAKTSRGATFTWTIGTDGNYESVYRTGLLRIASTKQSGTIRVEDGQIRWRSMDGQRGTLTVHEVGGRRVLRGTVDGQSVTFEATQAR